jgi:hypothetical protein
VSFLWRRFELLCTSPAWLALLCFALLAYLLAGSFEHMTTNAIGEASNQKAYNFLV